MPTSYSVRPNKHVDRELFADLVGRTLAHTPIENTAYVSMGGPQMADHFTMYRRNGISKLYSFDLNSGVVARQVFNSPTTTTVCVQHSASELPARIDQMVEDLNVDRLVVWLDYTGPSNRGAQLVEFQTVLENLSAGDVARISVDASLPSEKLFDQLSKAQKQDRLAAIYELLRREFGAFHPEDFVLGSQNDMPSYLAQCLERVCIRAVASFSVETVKIIPLLLTHYSDSSPMFTATVMLQDGSGQPAAPSGFAYLASNWSDIENLEVPELTSREKSVLDGHVSREVADVATELGFSIASRPEQQERQWSSFKRFHRFLPQFQHVELK